MAMPMKMVFISTIKRKLMERDIYDILNFITAESFIYIIDGRISTVSRYLQPK